MTIPSERPGPKPAPPELLVLARCEELCGWLLDRTTRWPKRLRFTLTQRIDNHALDVVEELIQARYRKDGRLTRLDRVNLVIERLRHLLRLAVRLGGCPPATFETAMRGLDEVGRMLHGWREQCRGRADGASRE